MPPCTVTLFGVLVIVTAASATEDYCKLSSKHTLCVNTGLGPACNGVSEQGFTPDEARQIVKIHNQFRSLVATGKEARGAPGPQMPAADMMKMGWDDELALIAQSHANQCVFAHDCSDCKKTVRFPAVGQNLYIMSSTADTPRPDVKAAITALYDEVDMFDGRSLTIPNKPGTGHYTQLLWAKTALVGCGYTKFVGDGGWFKKLYTCNYGPAGNYKGEPMYTIGNACSKCPSGSRCSKEFPGLCSTGSGDKTSPAKPSVEVTGDLPSTVASDGSAVPDSPVTSDGNTTVSFTPVNAADSSRRWTYMLSLLTLYITTSLLKEC